jgi:hypothetical protein
LLFPIFPLVLVQFIPCFQCSFSCVLLGSPPPVCSVLCPAPLFPCFLSFSMGSAPVIPPLFVPLPLLCSAFYRARARRKNPFLCSSIHERDHGQEIMVSWSTICCKFPVKTAFSAQTWETMNNASKTVPLCPRAWLFLI